MTIRIVKHDADAIVCTIPDQSDPDRYFELHIESPKYTVNGTDLTSLRVTLVQRSQSNPHYRGHAVSHVLKQRGVVFNFTRLKT